MGDRVVIQIIGKGEFSPVAYGHWEGERTPEIVARLKARMQGRGGDVPYTFARLMQEMIGDSEGNLSFGAWNEDHVLTPQDSQGDAGVVLIHVDQGFKCECFGGYLRANKAGMPEVAA